MKYGKIRGRDVSECLMKLRSQHGENAIVVQTRAVKGEGLFGAGILGKKEYEIDYMVPEDPSPGRSVVARRLGDRVGLTSPERSQKRREIIQRALGAAGIDASESEMPARFARWDRKQPSPEIPEIPAEPLPPAAGVGLDASDRAAIDMLLSDDPGEAPAMSARLPGFAPSAEERPQARRAPATPRHNADGPIFSGEVEGAGDERWALHFNRLRLRLLSEGFSEDFSRRFLRKLDNALSADEKSDFRKIEQRAVERLADIIQISAEIAPPRGECRAVFFMGPSGSGKTTSLAKVAARYHVMKQRDVSLYSLDHYRLAATEQLKTYASVMEAPFFAPYSPAEFAECLRRDGAELMLIDTSGIGARDHERLSNLKEYMEACEVRAERHLVLPADMAPEAMEKILLACDRIGADKITVTRLDESEKIGPLVELADKYNKPFAFFMNGQDVPADILDLTPTDLARRLLQEEGAGLERVRVAQGS